MKRAVWTLMIAALPLVLQAEELHYTQLVGLSPVAGVTGTGQARLPETVPLNTPGKELKSLSFDEIGDEPCYVRADDSSSDSAVWDRCGSSRFTIPRHLTGGALKKLRVCTSNRDGDRGLLVKGVESVWVSAPYFRDGAAAAVQRFARPSCRQWSDWVRCPSETSAGAVVIHHKRIGGKDSLVGLQLACYRSRSVTSSAYAPAWRRHDLRWATPTGELVSGESMRRVTYSLKNEPDGDRYFLSGLAVREHFDEPVQVGIFAEHSEAPELAFSGSLDLRNSRSVLDIVLSFLYPENPQNNERRAGLNSGQFNDANSSVHVVQPLGTEIRGVGVCTSRSQKVKGIRINYVVRDERGAVAENYTLSDDLPNCHRWHTNSTCGADEAVVGVKLFHHTAKGLTAIGVQCARVLTPGRLPRSDD